MPHSPQEKKKAISRLRRIRGQTEALERAIEAGTECGAVLQQLAALRGAVNGLVYEVLEGHLRETFGPNAEGQNAEGQNAEAAGPSAHHSAANLDQTIALIRSYLK